MGTDIPDLSSDIIAKAFSLLDEHDAVFGPAEDGGFYLLALRRLSGRLFQDVPWSSDNVLRISLERAAEAGLSVAPGNLLPTLRDLDTVEVLHNVPNLVDVHNKLKLLQSVGAHATYEASSSTNGTVIIRAQHLNSSTPCPAHVQELRSSFLLTGPVLARQGDVTMTQPGGCNIGQRPVDLHLRGLAAMGAQVQAVEGGYHLHLRSRRLQGATVFLDYPSVGATETLLMAASVAEGPTSINNAAMEPEVVELANMLTAMGCPVHGAGTSSIEVHPQASRQGSLSGVEWRVMPDRIEVGTYLAAAAITGSSLSIGPTIPAHIRPVISKLHSMGCITAWNEAEREPTIRISTPEWPLRATNVTALPFAGFPTDMQPQFTALLSVCTGSARVTDTVFEARMGHVSQLTKMGAQIRALSSNTAEVTGLSVGGVQGHLSAAEVTAPDLRAGAALVLAALAAEGVSEVRGLAVIDRGYAAMHEKLRRLGAVVERCE